MTSFTLFSPKAYLENFKVMIWTTVTNPSKMSVMKMLIVLAHLLVPSAHVNLVIQVMVLLALISTNVTLAPTTVIDLQTVPTPMATSVVPVKLVMQVMV